MPSWIAKVLKMFIRYGPMAWEAYKIGRAIVKDYIKTKKPAKQAIQDYHAKKKDNPAAHPT